MGFFPDPKHILDAVTALVFFTSLPHRLYTGSIHKFKKTNYPPVKRWMLRKTWDTTKVWEYVQE